QGQQCEAKRDSQGSEWSHLLWGLEFVQERRSTSLCSFMRYLRTKTDTSQISREDPRGSTKEPNCGRSYSAASSSRWIAASTSAGEPVRSSSSPQCNWLI